MQFEDWFQNEARPGSLDSEFDRRLAMAAWNKAIEQAVNLVANNFDEMEPWLTPEEMSELSVQVA